MHELVDLGHSMTHEAAGLCRDEPKTSEHIGISPAEEGWTVANDNEMYLVAALTCNVLQQHLVVFNHQWSRPSTIDGLGYPRLSDAEGIVGCCICASRGPRSWWRVSKSSGGAFEFVAPLPGISARFAMARAIITG
jgi:hypothetical protein